MNAKLVVMIGAAQGEAYVLDDSGSFSIGRNTTNDLVIPDWAVSREHCVIRNQSDGLWLQDLNSHNGTQVNDAPVTECLLSHGDMIRVGSWQLLLTLNDDEVFPPPKNVGFEDSLTTKSDIHRYLESAELSLPRELRLLMKLGQAVNELKDVQKLQRRLLEIVLDFIPAVRAAIVVDTDGENPRCICAVNKDGAGGQMPISRTVTRLVLHDQAPLLSNSLTQAKLDATESLVKARVSSVLCVPLSLNQIKGVLYLDSVNPDACFEEGHLRDLIAIAGLIAAVVTNTQHVEQLQREHEYFQSELILKTSMIGDCQRIRDIFGLIAKVGPADSTTLVTGESGTGKELVARAIHQNSSRRNKPFMGINCAVLNATLLESELFGHERGAFTGAVTQKKGKFEMADGGTVFLDEVAELSSEVQAKLLRFLQEREFQRVGGKDTIKVDVRLVSATNKDLKEAISQGSFRDDLFYRLSVVNIRLPPLRERSADIPLLAKHFVDKCSARCKRNVTDISEAAMAALTAYDWPGNVRELENAIECAIVLGSTDSIQIEDLPEAVAEARPPTKKNAAHLNAKLKVARQNIIIDAVREAGGNIGNAAKSLGILPSNLSRMIKRLGIRDEVRKYLRGPDSLR